MKQIRRSNNSVTLPGHRLTGRIYLTALYLVFLFAAMPARGGDLPNQYCPVTTSELAEEQFSVDYQGQQIYFCCSKCKKDFLSDPEAYLANLELTTVDANQSASSHDHDEGGHEDGESAAEATAIANKPDTGSSHDHATDHGEPSSLISFAGKFHPMVTHFPIALVISALLFSVLAAVFQIQTMDYVSVYSIYLAAITGIGTVLLGLAAGSAANYPSFLIEYFSWHRFLGITTGVVTMLTAIMGWLLLRGSSRRIIWSYRISLIINAVLVGLTGHFGATLVFGPDYFTN